MSDIITTLHPENDENINLYPNIKKENIPSKSVDKSKLGDDVLDVINGIADSLSNAIASIEQPKYYGTLPTTDKGLIVYSDGYLYSWNGTQYVTTGILYQALQIADSSVTPPKFSNTTQESYQQKPYIETKVTVTSLANWISTSGSLYTQGWHSVNNINKGIYLVTGYNVNNDGFPLYYVKNSLNEIVSQFSGTNSTNYTDVVVYVENDNNTIYINGSGTTSNIVLKKLEFSDLATKCIDLDVNKANKINTRKPIALYFDNVYGSSYVLAPSGISFNNYIISTTNTTYNEAHSIVLPVEPNFKYHVYGRQWNATFPCYVIRNASGEILAASSASDNSYIETDITMPDNASTITINGRGIELYEYVDVRENNLPSTYNIVGLGDSIMEGVGALIRVTGDTTKKQSFDAMSIMQENLGCNVLNAGIGGITLAKVNDSFLSVVDIVKAICGQSTWDLVDSTVEDIITSDGYCAYLRDNITALKNTDFTKVDVLFISAGFNDFRYFSRQIGNISSDEYTEIGAIALISQLMATYYPNVKIYLATAGYYYSSASDNADDYTNPTLNMNLRTYSNTIAAAIKEFSYPVYNIMADGGVNKYNYSYYLKDGVHRTIKGYELLGKQYAKFIKNN